MTDDPMIVILDTLAAHTEQIEQLGAARTGDAEEMTRRTSELAVLAQSLDVRIARLAGRFDQVIAAAAQDDEDESGYSPSPSRRWWKLTGPDRDEAVAALRAWTDQVYRPGYGQLAATLGPCWDQHTLCLYALDILAELWSVLYLTSERTPVMLSAQAEYQARILPALAEQMATETARCRHHRDQRVPGGDITRRTA